jgi:hypothetical protein
LLTFAAPNPLLLLADLLEAEGHPPDVFARMGYEPICKPRVLKRKALARERGIEEGDVPEFDLPPMCGQCPQERFHAATEFDLFYGGAAGGAKSAALVAEGVRAAATYPGLRVGAFRRSYPELEQSIIAELARLNYALALGATWTKTTHDLIFPNGSILMCRYAKSLDEAIRYLGGQYQLLLIDERTLMMPGIVDFLSSRLRSGDPKIPVLGIRSTGNPGGLGHGAMKARYIEATDHGAKTYQDERGRTVRFIPARLTDNPYLNPEYERDLDALPPAMRKAFKEGSWDSFLGQYFEEWSYDRHVVPRPREGLPVSWERWCGIDYGRRAPWAVLWLAVDGDGRVWLYRELYQTGVGVRDQARRILDVEVAAGETTVRHVIDPSTANHPTDGPSILEEYAQEGLGCLKADNDRIAGWTKVHAALADGPLCRVHEYLREQGRYGDDRCPMLHVLDGTCPNLVRELPALPFDTAKVEDVDSDAPDHAADALRYICQMMRGVGGPVIYDDEDRPVRAYKVLEMTPGAGTAASPFVTNGHSNGHSNGNGSK